MAQAIAVNPGFFGYRSGMGTVLLVEGNAAMAAQSFLRAVQLNRKTAITRVSRCGIRISSAINSTMLAPVSPASSGFDIHGTGSHLFVNDRFRSV
jgi:hypothetical protein